MHTPHVRTLQEIMEEGTLKKALTRHAHSPVYDMLLPLRTILELTHGLTPRWKFADRLYKESFNCGLYEPESRHLFEYVSARIQRHSFEGTYDRTYKREDGKLVTIPRQIDSSRLNQQARISRVSTFFTCARYVTNLWDLDADTFNLACNTTAEHIAYLRNSTDQEQLALNHLNAHNGNWAKYDEFVMRMGLSANPQSAQDSQTLREIGEKLRCYEQKNNIHVIEYWKALIDPNLGRSL